ncbi:hypothetical protein [uncultured Veillonella sp.]|uniref:hypothetical protein n=1 Tax=uncultured Veillonella sp. TaxID=159268 RepID=UPI0026319E55|nr:hypothetical protein [uncultured Veillonella sp.]
MHNFKGLEAQAVLVIDVETLKLFEVNMYRLMYAGCSSAIFHLQIAFYDDMGNTKKERAKIVKRFDLQVIGKK